MGDQKRKEAACGARRRLDSRNCKISLGLPAAALVSLVAFACGFSDTDALVSALKNLRIWPKLQNALVLWNSALRQILLPKA